MCQLIFSFRQSFEGNSRGIRHVRRFGRAVLLISFVSLQIAATPQFDFTQPGAEPLWKAAHDVASLRIEPEGLVIKIAGDDPYIESPAVPTATGSDPTCLRVRLKSEAGGLAQLFWFTNRRSEDQSVSFAVSASSWTDICVPLPPLEKGTRLRFDPPGTSGDCIVAWMHVEELNAGGIIRIKAAPDQLNFAIHGINGEFEVAELAPNQSLSEAVSAPVAHRGNGTGNGEFTIPRFETVGEVKRDRIYSAFVPLQVHQNVGKASIGPARFVDDFTGVSHSDAPFPVTKSKKGLQIQMADDALKLGVQHAAINVDLTTLIDLTNNPANPEFRMDGRSYFFNRNYVESLPVKSLSDAGCAVTMILLSYQSGDPAKDAIMLHPRRAPALPNRLAAFNTATDDGVRHYKACLEFLAERFSRSDNAYGRASNYIVGNEVSAHWEWYNLGLSPRELVVAEYEKAVRIAHTAVRKYSSTSRVYLSLEHHWTLTFGGNTQKAVAGRRFLEEFNRRAKLGGDFDWHLAYHPYPENLFQPRTWLDKSARASIETPRITFKNLDQLTRYFGRPELLIDGQRRRIILSEQGFHSDNSSTGDTAQAAAYCYAWIKATRDDGIDAFILHRHVDHSGEGGLNLGLWRRQPDSIATPSTPRPMYDVFLKADTPEWEEAFKFALPVIGIKAWDEILRKR